jgi:hypothetical protein
VHATTGVLPVAQVTIPPGHYTASLASLSLALATRPVLTATGKEAMSLALPKVGAGQWLWVTTDGQRWDASVTADAPSAAALDYTPQRIAEGWLVLRPDSARRTQDRTDIGRGQP